MNHSLTPSHQALQNFVYAISYGKCPDLDITTTNGQEQTLDYLIQLMQYCERFDQKNLPEGFHIHPEFFAFPCVKQFFIDLFANLHEDLSSKAEAAFLRGLSFTVEYIGLPKSREIMYQLLEKLRQRFPVFTKKYDKAISNFIVEFFRPTVGEFLDQYKDAEKHLQTKCPIIHELFIAPLSTAPVSNSKLFNFYCNPWIYCKIMNYFARFSLPTIKRDLLEMPLQILENRLQTIRTQTNDESWSELACKAQEALNHSGNLEHFGIEIAGLAGEIKAAAQFIEDSCNSDDVLIFLPKLTGKPSCDLMVMRHATKCCELIECKTKTPRHGLGEKTAGDAQIWDDFFTNFSGAINCYLAYLQDTIQPPMGFTKLFPLLVTYEGSGYAQALPLIQDLSTKIGIAPLKTWTSEQKVSYLLRTLFLRPLVLDSCCAPLPSHSKRFKQRQQATEATIKKEWIISILNKATKQLKETFNHLTAEGYNGPQKMDRK